MYLRLVTNPVRELKKVDASIATELTRSRETLLPLLERREEIVREACATQIEGALRPESQADMILELATRKAPQTITPSEVYLYLRERVGDAVTLNLATAWLSKLARSGKLKKRKRGVYALS